MRNTILLFLAVITASLTSCRSDFDFRPSTGGLRFSRDTVYLDTVFTNIGSSTYTLKVYNNSDSDISIPTIQLGRGLSSNYRIMVDGMTGEDGKIFHNVEMLARDSLFIFIETTSDVADANPDTFLYTDQIQFGDTGNFQTVELVTLIQDAVFLYPSRENGVTETISVGQDADGNDVRRDGFFLDDSELHFTDEKPYVIYGFAAVGDGKTLNIDPGARVHFHYESALIAFEGATININGQASEDPVAQENQVIFEGDRLEPEYSEMAGQWFGVVLFPGSRGVFDNLTIRNATFGIYAYGYTTSFAYSLELTDVQVYNSATAGIYGQTARIRGRNVVVNNAGVYSLACTYGGKYNFTHSTFNNDQPSSNHAAVYVSNNIDDAVPPTEDLDEATFQNCIIYGSNGTEVVLDRLNAGDSFEYYFNHCLLKINPYSSSISNNPLYDLSDSGHFNACLIAEDSFTNRPYFWDADSNKMNITTESAAVGQGDAGATNQAPNDILDVLRNIPADLGAYQAMDQPEAN